MPDGGNQFSPVSAHFRLTELAEELRHQFRILYGVTGAETAMARELILLQIENARLRDERHRAFYREPRR